MTTELASYMKGVEPLGRKWEKLRMFINSLEGPMRLDEVKILVEPLEGTHFEPFIAIQLAQKFCCPQLVVDLVKSARRNCVRGGAKCPWMYAEGGRFRDPGFVVDELFPVVSHRCRQLMINAILEFIKDEEVVDKFFDKICTKYGFGEAKHLLVGTSKDKFHQVARNRKCSFNQNELCRVLEKDPEIVLQQSASSFHRYFQPVLLIIARKMPMEFFEREILVETYLGWHGPGSIGRKWIENLATKHPEIIYRFAKQLIDIPSSYRNTLRCRLGSEGYKKLLRQMFPTIADLTKYRTTEFLSWLPDESSEVRFQALNEIFQEVVGYSLSASFEFLPRELVIEMPGAARDKVIDAIISKRCDLTCWMGNPKERHPASWIALKGTGMSVKELSHMLFNSQDVKERAYIAKMVIKTSIFNSDESSFIQVLDLLLARCRNDAEEVRSNIMEGISSAAQKLYVKGFRSQEAWRKMLEFIKLQNIYNEGRGYYLTNVFMWQLRVLLDKNIDINSFLDSYNEFSVCDNVSPNRLIQNLIIDTENNYDGFKFTMEERWTVLGAVCNKFRSWLNTNITHEVAGSDEAISSDDTINNAARKEFANLLFEFLLGASHSTIDSQKLQVYPGLIEYAARVHPTYLKWFQNPVYIKSDFCFAEDTNRDTRGIHPKFTWCQGEIDNYVKIGLFLSELKTNPQFTIDECSTCLPIFMEPFKDSVGRFKARQKRKGREGLARWQRRFARCFKYFAKQENNALNDRIVSYFREILNSSSNLPCSPLISCAILALSQILPDWDFLPLVRQFAPTKGESRMNFENINEEKVKLDKIITAAWSIKFLEGSVKNMEEVEQFCVGDYLKYAFGSFCSIAVRCPALEVLKYLEGKLLEGPVSFRKHLVRLYFRIGGTEDRLKGLRHLTAAKEEKNATIRLETLKLLCTNQVNSPSDQTFVLLQNYYASQKPLESKDWNATLKDTFQYLPYDSLPQFLQFWREVLEDPAIPNRELGLKNFFEFVKDVLDHIFDVKFLEKLIHEVQSIVLSSDSCNYNDLYIKLLVHYIFVDSQESCTPLARMEKVVVKLLGAANLNMEKYNVKVNLLLVDLGATLFEGIGSKKTTVELLNLLANLLSKEERRASYFKPIFRASFMVAISAYLTTGFANDPELSSEIGRKTGEVVDDTIQLYGTDICALLPELLKGIIENYIDTEAKLVAFIESLVGTNGSRYRKICAIKFIRVPEHYDFKYEVLPKNVQKQLSSKILEGDDMVVTCYYNAFILSV